MIWVSIILKRSNLIVVLKRHVNIGTIENNKAPLCARLRLSVIMHKINQH